MNPARRPWQRPNQPRARLIPHPKLKFQEQCRQALRHRRLSPRSAPANLDWIKRFMLFQDKRHSRGRGAPEATGFLTRLAAFHRGRAGDVGIFRGCQVGGHCSGGRAGPSVSGGK